MIRKFSFLAVGILITLSANSQGVDLITSLAKQQLSDNISDIKGGSKSLIYQSSNKKTTQNEIQQLDSIIYYSYDEEHEEWDLKRFKISIFYDKNYNDTLILQSQWDKTNNSWLIIIKEIKKYEMNGKIKSREIHLISRSRTRTEYAYNDNNDLIEVTESYLSSGEWRYRKRNVFDYNSKNLLQTDTLYLRFTISGIPVWHKVSITNLYYNSEESLIADTTNARSWIKGNNFSDWELFGKTDYNSWIKENTSETVTYRWSSELKAFRPYLKEKILYQNGDKDISTLSDFKWNTGLNLWDTSAMTHYIYSKDDFVISIEKLSWENSRSKVLETFNFDYSVNNDKLLLPATALYAIPRIAFHHKINSKKSARYNYSTHETQKFLETKYYYSTINKAPSTSVHENSHASVKLYPNPASETITVGFSDSFREVRFELFDVSGKKVLSKAVNKGEDINISNLKSGLYFYSIWNDEQKAVGKLLIK